MKQAVVFFMALIITLAMGVHPGDCLSAEGTSIRFDTKEELGSGLIEFLKGTPFWLRLPRTDERGNVKMNAENNPSYSYLPFINIFSPKESVFGIFMPMEWKNYRARNSGRLASVIGLAVIAADDDDDKKSDNEFDPLGVCCGG